MIALVNAVVAAVSGFFQMVWAFITSPVAGIIGFFLSLFLFWWVASLWIAIHGIGIGFHLWPFGQINLYAVEGWEQKYDALDKKYAADEDSIHNPTYGWATRLNVCHGNVAALQHTIGNQNAAIVGLQDRAKLAETRLDAALAAMRNSASAAQRTAAALLAMRAGTGEDQCAFAQRVVGEAIHAH